jgi:hypothetical protein
MIRSDSELVFALRLFEAKSSLMDIEIQRVDEAAFKISVLFGYVWTTFSDGQWRSTSEINFPMEIF